MGKSCEWCEIPAYQGAVTSARAAGCSFQGIKVWRDRVGVRSGEHWVGRGSGKSLGVCGESGREVDRPGMGPWPGEYLAESLNRGHVGV